MAGLLLLGGLFGAVGALPALWSFALSLDAVGTGICFASLAVSMLATMLTSGQLRHRNRLPARGAAAAGAFLIGAAMIALSFVDRDSWLPYPLAVAGLGMGLTAAATGESLSRALTRRRAPALLHLSGAFFGFGAVAVCGVAWLLAEPLGWQNLCRLLGAMAIVLAVGIWRGPKLVIEKADLPAGASKTTPITILLFLTLLIQACNHGLLGGWLALYLTRQFEITTLGSLGVLMAFWTALTCGRVLAGRLAAFGNRTRTAAVVSGFVVLGCLFLLNSVERSGVVAGSLLLGAGMGALHPLTLEYVAHSPVAPAAGLFRLTFATTLLVGLGSAAGAAPLANTHGIDAVMWLALWLAVATPVALALIAIETRLSAAAAPAG